MLFHFGWRGAFCPPGMSESIACARRGEIDPNFHLIRLAMGFASKWTQAMHDGAMGSFRRVVETAPCCMSAPGVWRLPAAVQATTSAARV